MPALPVGASGRGASRKCRALGHNQATIRGKGRARCGTGRRPDPRQGFDLRQVDPVSDPEIAESEFAAHVLDRARLEKHTFDSDVLLTIRPD